MKYIIDVDTIAILKDTTLIDADIINFFDNMLSYFRYHNKNLNAAQESFIYELDRIIENTNIRKVEE